MVSDLVALFQLILFSSLQLDWFWLLSSAFICVSLVCLILRSFIIFWRRRRGE